MNLLSYKVYSVISKPKSKPKTHKDKTRLEVYCLVYWNRRDHQCANIIKLTRSLSKAKKWIENLAEISTESCKWEIINSTYAILHEYNQNRNTKEWKEQTIGVQTYQILPLAKYMRDLDFKTVVVGIHKSFPGLWHAFLVNPKKLKFQPSFRDAHGNWEFQKYETGDILCRARFREFDENGRETSLGLDEIDYVCMNIA